ncbi:cof protein [Lucifera butyrica]|uniref:Cof protein n=1 Tax=Lucifera butyrica TaxID=1351585 RepID=A0A498R9M4_9FIRM|nr:Cof-type HAD-IIB family hydrolase [Lucifera butyrica]VBB07657.1 cof protein [Lucifera butyrica]
MRLIAIDLDGTLLNSRGEVSPQNRQAINHAQKAGIEIAIATGRSYREASEFCRQTGLNAHIITSNGASVHSRQGILLAAVTLARQDVKEILAWLEEHHYYFEVTSENGLYTVQKGITWLDEEISRLAATNPVLYAEDYKGGLKSPDRPLIPVASAALIWEQEMDYYKVFAFTTDAEKLRAGSERFKNQTRLTVVSSLDHNFEIIHRNASKGYGVKVLADSLQISLSEVVAIGDNENDLSMLAAAGYSVAMGNAKDPIKASCSFITRTNDEHGVAHAIYHILGKKIPA